MQQGLLTFCTNILVDLAATTCKVSQQQHQVNLDLVDAQARHSKRYLNQLVKVARYEVGCDVLIVKMHSDRAANHLLVSSNDESSSRHMQKQAHRLKRRYGCLREAAVKVIDQHY
ncbi:hypothetical protein SDC9_189308 [bioreactor metagenome]|uniref:Uncharacterized protein n=1 Tax=bioreactor metagenome TaxID=1076179 RepID=A0A645I2M7_9ZZZZ